MTEESKVTMTSLDRLFLLSLVILMIFSAAITKYDISLSCFQILNLCC
jgi:hypothetical protein